MNNKSISAPRHHAAWSTSGHHEAMHQNKTRHQRWIDGPIAKRIFDIGVSCFLLVFLAPAFIVISLAILVCRDGPVFYGHTRVGYGGKSFKCLKFRTMHQDSERVLEQHLAECSTARDEWDRTRKLQNDPRVSTIGHLLRISSLDELPQLVNVLRGEMSLVGPRPVPADELVNYGRHSVSYYNNVPGITGLWQVSGRNNTTYPERVALDVSYCSERTMFRDVSILSRTVLVVLTGHGAF